MRETWIPGGASMVTEGEIVANDTTGGAWGAHAGGGAVGADHCTAGAANGAGGGIHCIIMVCLHGVRAYMYLRL